MIKRKKIKFCIISCLIVFATFHFNINNVHAHEIFYDGNVGVPLKWHDVTNGVAHLKMNGEMLEGNYSTYYTVVRRAWPNAFLHFLLMFRYPMRLFLILMWIYALQQPHIGTNAMVFT